MKNALLLLIGLLLAAPGMEAQERIGKRNYDTKRQLLVEPIVFVENNILFSVFPDGTMKFKRFATKKKGFHKKHKTKYDRSLNVKRDYRGRVVRVGNVPIYYKRGMLDRIGSVDFKYRRGQLKMVGNLYIVYRRNGQYLYLGDVKKHSYRPHTFKIKKYS